MHNKDSRNKLVQTTTDLEESLSSNRTEGEDAMRYLKRFFPHKVRSLEEFVALVKKLEASSVSIQYKIRTPVCSDQMECVANYFAETTEGRPIIFHQSVWKRSVSIGEGLGMLLTNTTHTLAADTRPAIMANAEELRAKLPDLPVAVALA